MEITEEFIKSLDELNELTFQLDTKKLKLNAEEIYLLLNGMVGLLDQLELDEIEELAELAS